MEFFDGPFGTYKFPATLSRFKKKMVNAGEVTPNDQKLYRGIEQLISDWRRAYESSMTSRIKCQRESNSASASISTKSTSASASNSSKSTSAKSTSASASKSAKNTSNSVDPPPRNARNTKRSIEETIEVAQTRFCNSRVLLDSSMLSFCSMLFFRFIASCFLTCVYFPFLYRLCDIFSLYLNTRVEKNKGREKI